MKAIAYKGVAGRGGEVPGVVLAGVRPRIILINSVRFVSGHPRVMAAGQGRALAALRRNATAAAPRKPLADCPLAPRSPAQPLPILLAGAAAVPRCRLALHRDDLPSVE